MNGQNGLLEKLKGLLNNPYVQGVGTAVGFGANPLMGLLAGGVMSGNREQRSMVNEARRNQLASINNIQGILNARTEPVNFQRGIGTGVRGNLPPLSLLDVEGGDPTTYGSPEDPFPSYRGVTQPLPLTPDSQNALMAEFMNVPGGPQAIAQGLFSPPDTTSEIQNIKFFNEQLDELGKEPLNADEMMAFITRADPAVMLELQKLQLTIDSMDREDREEAVLNLNSAGTTDRSVDKLLTMVNLVEFLEGTYSELDAFSTLKRQFLPQITQIAEWVGKDVSDIQTQVDARALFDQLAAQLYADSVVTFGDVFGTDAGAQILAGAKPGGDSQTTIQAIAAIQDMAKQYSWLIKNRREAGFAGWNFDSEKLQRLSELANRDLMPLLGFGNPNGVGSTNNLPPSSDDLVSVERPR